MYFWRMNWKLFLIFFLSYYSSAQSELTFRNYAQEMGLESSTIYDVIQDKEGYIYVGHDKGCSKFNGLYFNRPISNEESNALGNFIVFPNNQVLCRNFQGKCFNLKNGVLSPITVPLESSWGFPTLLEDGDDHYIFRDNELAFIDENGKGNLIKLNIPKAARIYHGVIKDKIAYLYVSFRDKAKLLAFDLIKNKVIETRQFSIDSSVRLFKTNGEVFWLNETTGEIGDAMQGFRTLALLFDGILHKGSKFTDFIALKDGRKLIGTFNGLYVLDREWKVERHYLNGIQCSKIFIDKDNAIWIGSIQNGLFYVPSIDFFQVNTEDIDGKNVKFSKFYSDGNALYAGTYDGRILKFNDKGDILQTIDFQRNSEIQSIFIEGNILYAYCSGLIKADLFSGKELNEWKWHATKSIYDDDNHIYLGTSKGLGVLSEDKLSAYFETEWIKQVLPFNDANLLIENTDEIYRFNIQTKKKTIIQKKGSSIKFLNGKWFFKTENTIYVLYPNGKKKNVFHSKTKINRLFVRNNLLFIELNNNKWISISPDNYAIKRVKDKFSLKEILYMTEIGDFFVQANNTTIQYLKKNVSAPQTHLKLKELDNIVKNGLDDTPIVLPFSNNEISFSFDLLPNYQYKDAGEVYYRIVGLDEEWRKLAKGDKYTVELLRIPSGNYTLEIYGTNGTETTEILRYSLCVLQPYYFQWWFVFICILVLTIMIYILVRRRAKLIQVKNDRKIKEQELKLNALNSELTAIRSQMNPHFIFNSLSSIQTKILNEDRVEAYKNLNTFSTLLRQALQFTSKEFLTLIDEISFTRNYIQLEQTRTSDAFEYKEEIDPDLNPEIERVPSLFLQPFVENAIRHGLMHSKGKKCLCIKISKLENGFRVIIEDNGVGRTESYRINHEQRPEHESFATNAIQDRIDILNETKKMKIDLKIIDLEKGTRVEINFLKYESK